MIIIIIATILILGVLAAFVVMGSQSGAKKDAKQMIAAGEITDWKKYKRTVNVLALMTDDLEAIELYRKLRKLAER